MAYEPKTWTCGETITADALNHIEDGIANASGYECTETARVAYDGQFTADTPYTSSYCNNQLAYDGEFGSTDSLSVTFEGTKYTAPKQDFLGYAYYGAPYSYGVIQDWSEYPFCLMWDSSTNAMRAIVQQQGTYTMKVEEVSTEVTTDACFEEAVKKVVPEGDSVEVITFVEGENCGYTPAEIKEKLDADNVVFKFRTTTLASHANVPVSVEPIYGNGGFEGIRVYAFRTDSFGNNNITVERYNVDVDGTLIKNATRTIALTSNN